MTQLSLKASQPLRVGVVQDAEPRGEACAPARGGEGEGAGSGVIERVYDRAAVGFYRFFLVRTGHDEHLSRDLMQQLFLAALKTGRGVPEEELEYWLRTVAKRILATHWRRAKVRSKVRSAGVGGEGEDGTGASLLEAMGERMTTAQVPAEVLAKSEVRGELLRAITELDAADQEIIVAHYVEGAPLGQIAERLSTSARAVEGRLYRARAALRKRLGAFAQEREEG